MTHNISPESIAIADELLAMPSNPFVPAVPAIKLPSPERIHEDAERWAHGATDERLASCLVEVSADVLALRSLSAETAEMACLVRDLAFALGASDDGVKA